MEQHPMPRQITTFEFKLIGFLTLKQFIYLAVFIPLGYIVYKLFPIPLFSLVFAAFIAGSGVAFAFVPINDRPLDVWIKNLFKRLTSPTQYMYQKQNPPIYFLKNLFFLSDPHRVMTHVESQEKLAAYLVKTGKTTIPGAKKQAISILLQKPSSALQGKKTGIVAKTQPIVDQQKTPFFTGVVKNHKLIPLPGILIYLKNEKGNMVRLLKTNPHGVFATFNPLPASEYLFEFKDPKNTYFFATMKMRIEGPGSKPLEFFSKELI